ncbi:MerR family transcriptional regulator [Methylovirgula ligni]|uniref:MerR family transcriptional regulator n=1 Tax=Methylovirgula ligni TaxID=569860 RepID=A0A3D9YTA1_9HYPH|nr:MerR family transcriptional regulator [Methylovirgula ligni]QAY96579.1 MerR family transcriptional regulator [Methylovirgula ligni]REF84112.1 MerR family transcriptional regulator [Methylovirgula ligni]
MKIGEIAQRAGVSTSRLRFYEAKGLLRASRSANGYRSYEAKTVKIVGIIERAQHLGFSLREIAALLAMPPEQRKRPEAFIPYVEAKLREIDAHLREVQKRRRELRNLLEQLVAESKSGKTLKRYR